MKMIFYVLIGGAVFAVAYFAEAFFGISLSSSTSSLEPTGFVMSRFLVQTLTGVAVGFAVGVIDRWRSHRRRRNRVK